MRMPGSRHAPIRPASEPNKADRRQDRCKRDPGVCGRRAHEAQGRGLAILPALHTGAWAHTYAQSCHSHARSLPASPRKHHAQGRPPSCPVERSRILRRRIRQRTHTFARTGQWTALAAWPSTLASKGDPPPPLCSLRNCAPHGRPSAHSTSTSIHPAHRRRRSNHYDGEKTGRGGHFGRRRAGQLQTQSQAYGTSVT